MAQLQVELVAADRHVWKGEASKVSARSVEGDIGILPGHSPVLAVLTAGKVTIEESAGGRRVSEVDGGILSVDKDRVTIVAETVTTSDAN